MLLRRYYEDYSPRREVKAEQAEASFDVHAAESTPYEELTNPQLKALLDARGVQYNTRATKTQLIELLKG